MRHVCSLNLRCNWTLGTTTRNISNFKNQHIPRGPPHKSPNSECLPSESNESPWQHWSFRSTVGTASVRIIEIRLIESLSNLSAPRLPLLFPHVPSPSRSSYPYPYHALPSSLGHDIVVREPAWLIGINDTSQGEICQD